MKGFLLILLFPLFSWGQQACKVNFVFTFNNEPLEKETWYLTENNDSITLETVQFFVSQAPEKNNKVSADQVQLIDWEKEATHFWELKSNKSLHFTFGLDSIYHVSSIMTGDLDPSLGLYWAWQSGYIQLKIEGKSPSSTARKNKFEYHLGGYLAPFDVSKEIDLGPVSSENVTVEVKLDTFFQNLEMAKTNAVLIPGDAAVQLMKQAKKMFVLN